MSDERSFPPPNRLSTPERLDYTYDMWEKKEIPNESAEFEVVLNDGKTRAFVVNRHFLATATTFFSEEAIRRGDTFDLKQFTPESLRLFLLWVRGNTLTPCTILEDCAGIKGLEPVHNEGRNTYIKKFMKNLTLAWVLGEVLGSTSFQDFIMDAMLHMELTFRQEGYVLSMDTIGDIMRAFWHTNIVKTDSVDSQLMKFFVDACIYINGSRTERRWKNIPCPKTTQKLAIEREDYYFHSGNYNGPGQENPLDKALGARIDYEPTKCFYHVHGEGEACYLSRQA